MRVFVVAISVLFVIISCSSNDSMTHSNRFIESLLDADKIGTLTQLTDDGQYIYPFFAPGDSIIVSKRLLVGDQETAANLHGKELTKYIGMNINTDEIYNLNEAPDFPMRRIFKGDSLLSPDNEPVTMAIQSPNDGIYAIETVIDIESDRRAIYLVKSDSLIQLSFGETSCYLDRFSNSGRYLTAILGNDPTWVLIFDLEKNTAYRIENQNYYFDYMTSFSSDDKTICFLRSGKTITNDLDFFGDIWMFKFKD